MNNLASEIELTLTVHARRDVASGIVVLDMGAADGSPLPEWQPGAHADFRLPGGLTRQYSLCGDPDERHTWRIAVLREENSRGGSRLIHDEIHAGDSLIASRPRNHFPLQPADRYHFVAGGIGITPLLPMMAQATRNGVDWQLTYGGRTKQSMAFAEELADTYPGRVSFHPQDLTGLLDLETLFADLHPTTEVYACGPGALLDALTRHTGDRPDRLHIERFTAVEQVAPAERREFDIELASSGRVLQVSAEESILDVLFDNDVYVPTSCEEGTCGSCMTRVLAGEVDHRDAVLSAAERANNESLMVCVSRAAATCHRLVLDL